MLTEMMDCRDAVRGYRARPGTASAEALAEAAGHVSEAMTYAGADSAQLAAMRAALRRYRNAGHGFGLLAAGTLADAFDEFARSAHGSRASQHGTPVPASAAQAGLWVDGTGDQGYFNCSRMVLRARDHGWGNPAAIALAEREIAGGRGTLSDAEGDALGFRYAAEAEYWLNEHVAPGGYLFGWHNFSFYLQPRAWWDECGGPDQY
jgi:hypothetical protein